MVVVIHGMELACTFPALDSCETGTPEERGATYRDNGVTFQFAETATPALHPAASDIGGFCLRNHKAAFGSSFSYVSRRSKASMEL